MELDKIKSKTTWSDASASLNENFARILKGIREGIPTIETPVDEQMSDESENAVQNKVIKKYVDDEAVHLEGYAEELVNHLEDDIKANPSQYVKLKTINGKSLYGTGNIVIEGGEGSGGGGLQYAIERTVYLTENGTGDHKATFEISEEERAYNRQTFEMARNDQPVFVSLNGAFAPVVTSGPQRVVFNIVADVGEASAPTLISNYLTIYPNGDATATLSFIQTGSISEDALEGYIPLSRDFSDDFNNDFAR